MARVSRIFQWFFIFSCFLVLGATAAEQNLVSFKDSKGNLVNLQYESLGCYNDNRERRALRSQYFDARSLIDWQLWPDFTYIVHACLKNAYNKGYRNIMGIQYYGECWSDGSGESRYSKYGVSKNCIHGVGKELANEVYRYTVIPKSPAQQCNANGKEYSEGAEMLIPNDWTSNVLDAQCMRCTCTGGQAKDCQRQMYCETGFQGLCSKWRNATGECCPVCDCYNDGKAMELGSKWLVRDGSKCSECTCGANKVATCTTRQTMCVCVGDYEAIPQPGKCCPKCVPKTTTSSPPVTIILPTERPPPTFPPFPMP